MKKLLEPVDTLDVQMADGAVVRAVHIGRRQYASIIRGAHDLHGETFQFFFDGYEDGSYTHLHDDGRMEKLTLFLRKSICPDYLLNAFLRSYTRQIIGGSGTVKKLDGKRACVNLYLDPLKEDKFCEKPLDGYEFKRLLRDWIGSDVHDAAKSLNAAFQTSTFGRWIQTLKEPFYVNALGHLTVRSHPLLDGMKEWRELVNEVRFQLFNQSKSVLVRI